MKPIRLEIEGFTVYKTKQVINFENLDFFVIQGKTGSGKTSIVDAITFALYGKVPRYEGIRGSLRDLVISKGSNKLRIIFEFSVGERRYRVEHFALLNGSAQVRVYENGRRLNVSLKDLEKWTKKVLGLDYNTFTKVILLPQGAFDRLLKEKGKKRRELLINLMNMQVFEKIRSLASERLREIEGRLKTIEMRLTDLKEITEELINSLKIKKDELNKEERSLKERVNILREELEKVKERENLEKELKELKSELSKLEALIPKKKEEEEKLNRAKEVLPFLPYIENIERIDVKLNGLKREKEKNLMSLKEIENEINNVQERLKELDEEYSKIPQKRERLTELEKEKERLKDAVEILKEIKQRSELRDKISLKLKEVKEDLKVAKEKLEKIKEEGIKTRERLDSISFDDKLFEELLIKSQKLKDLRKKREKFEKLKENIETLEKKKKEISEILSKLEKKKETLEKKLKEEEMEHYAILIRKMLKEGDLCPVCGNTFTETHREEKRLHIEELTSELEKIKEEVSVNERKLYELEANLKRYKGEYGELLKDIEEYEALERENIEYKLEELRKVKEEKAELEKKLERLRNEYEALRDKVISLENEKVRLEENIKGLGKDVEERREKLKKYGYEESEIELRRLLFEIEENIKKLKEEIEKIENERNRARDYVVELENKRARLESTLSSINKEIDSLEKERRENFSKLSVLFERFGSIENIRKASMSKEEIEKKEMELRDFFNKLENIKKRKEELENKLKGYEDVRERKEVETELLKAENALEEVQKAKGEIEEKIRNTEKELKEKKLLTSEKEKLKEELHIYKVISEDLRSDRLQNFVASLMLKKIIDRASAYMLELTGVYELTLDSEGNINVVDRVNGVERSIDSLSGGETFLASLALAFGVSDILAGDGRIESLFIDEGFGSLDEDMREKVSDILEKIKQRINRKVGIITHMRDIAERFHQRIIVRKHGDYSTLEVIYG